MMSNHALSFNDHFFCTGWQTMPVFVSNIIYKPLLTSWTRIFLFNIILTEVDTFTSITHHYSNAITQFITQFITQIPLLKSLLIITQMSFSLLIITPPLLKGHFADGCQSRGATDTSAYQLVSPSSRIARCWCRQDQAHRDTKMKEWWVMQSLP